MSKLKKYKLDKLYEISSGISTKPEQYGKGSPFVSFSTIFNNYFLPDELPELMETSEQEQKTYSVKKGDVFLTRTSETLDELAMSSIAIKDYPRATFSGFAKRLRPIQEDITYDKYMGFFLRSKYFRKIIDNNAIMTLRASFNEAIFSYINIYLPDYNQQVKIGNLLYKIEEKIKLNNKINAELENIAKDLYDYWFVQFDFPDKNGKPYKSCGGRIIHNNIINRDIPENWNCAELGTICNLYQPHTISDKEMKKNGVYTVFGANGPIGFYDKYNHENSEIVISCRGTCGNIIRTLPKSWITGNAMVIKPKNEYIHNEFIYQSLKYANIKQAITGSVQKQITRNNLEKVKIIMPPIDLINKYNESIKDNIVYQLLNQYANAQLQKLRAFLLPMFISCQVNISDKIEDNLSEEKIIEKSLEFWKTHGKMDLDKFAKDNGILVYKDNEQKKGAVSYNAEKDLYEIAVKDPRDNFTIAHEIGHILKHKKELKTGTLGRKSEESGSKIMEYEADFLAAEILMPEEYVLQYMQNENKTDKEFLDEKFIKSCAKKFDVTPPAMNIRLKNLGYKVPYLK